MYIQTISGHDAAQYSPVTLAYIGDSVYELMVRSRLILEGDRRIEDFHKRTVGFVRSEAQKAAIEKLIPVLHEDEMAIVRRGRNAKNTVSRNAASHRIATGFEALLGYLYLTGRFDRINELFEKIISDINDM